MRKLLTVLALIAPLSAASAGNFSLYPGFVDPDAIVEMTTDKGLIVEVVLRCDRRADGEIIAGIMTYSKIEKLFCSSKHRCFRDAVEAYEDTCF